MEFEKRHPGMLTALHKQWPDAWNPDAFDRYWTRMKLRTGLQWPWQMGNAQEVDDCYAEAMRALGKPRQGLWQSVKMRGLDYTEYKRRWAQENE